MTTTKVLMLLISCIISAVFVNPTSSQHLSFAISSSLDAQQWSGTWHHPANPAKRTSPSPVWLPETPPPTEAPPSWAGGESTSVRTVRLAHVHRIKTSTVFTSQAWLVTADRLPPHAGQTVNTLRPVSSVASVMDNRGTSTRASQSFTDIRQNFATKETLEGSASVLNDTVTTSGRTLSVTQLKTVAVPSRQTPPIAILGASSEDITNSSIQSTSVALPVRSGENGVNSDETKPVKGEHDLLSVEDDLRIGESSVQVSDSEDVMNSYGISDDQNVSHDGRGDPLMVIETTGDQTLLLARPPSGTEVTEGSGDATADTTPVEPAPMSWISEQFLALSEPTHRRSRDDGVTADNSTQVPELSEDMDRTNRSVVEPLFSLAETNGPFSTTAMPVELDDQTTSRGNEIGNVITSAEKYKAGISPFHTTVLKLSTTPRLTNIITSDDLPHITSVNDPEEWDKYAVSEEQKEPGSGDTMWLLPPVSLPVLGGNHDTSTLSLSPTNTSSRLPNPSTDAPPESLPTIAAETIDIRKIAAAEPNTSRNPEDLATGRSASSLDDRFWLWAMMVPVLVVLLLLIVAVYWRLLRLWRRKLDISSSGGGGGLGAASQWSQPAQPVLHSCVLTAFDPDESLLPPPPSYREHVGVGATNAPSVSLELEESQASSRRTSGTDVSTESV